MNWSLSGGTAGTIQTMHEIAMIGRGYPAPRSLRIQPPALDRWLRAHWIEVPDGFDELLRTIPDQLQNLDRTGFMLGDCDDAAAVALALAPHSPAIVTAIRWPRDPHFSHVYATILDSQGNAHRIDPIMPRDIDYSHAEHLNTYFPAISVNA